MPTCAGGVVRLDCERRLEILKSERDVLGRESLEVKPALQDRVVGPRVDGRALRQATGRLGRQHHPDLLRDSPGDLPVDAENALDAGRKRLRPEWQLGRPIVEADVYEDAVA